MATRQKSVTLATLLATVILAIFLISESTVPAGEKSVVTTAILSFVLVAVGLAVFFVPSVRSAPLELSGKYPAKILSVALVLVGVLMIIGSGVDLFTFITTGALTYPPKTAPSFWESLLFCLQTAFGFLSGAFFLLLALIWFYFESFKRGFMRLLALSPVVWMWIRVLRFEMSQFSSVKAYYDVTGLLMLIAETGFLMMFAQYVSKTEKNSPRMLGFSLCTALFATLSPLLRFAAYVRQDSAAFLTGGLVAPTDPALALLALAFAVCLLWDKWSLPLPHSRYRFAKRRINLGRGTRLTLTQEAFEQTAVPPTETESGQLISDLPATPTQAGNPSTGENEIMLLNELPNITLAGNNGGNHPEGTILLQDLPTMHIAQGEHEDAGSVLLHDLPTMHIAQREHEDTGSVLLQDLPVTQIARHRDGGVEPMLLQDLPVTNRARRKAQKTEPNKHDAELISRSLEDMESFADLRNKKYLSKKSDKEQEPETLKVLLKKIIAAE